MRILGTTGDEQVKLSRATSTTKAFAPHHQRASSLFRWGSVAALNIGLLACTPSPAYDDGGDFPRIITSSNGLRPTDLDAILPRFAATDQVRTLETTNFKVHFSTNGPNAIPTNDADATGEPDYAEFVLDTFEASLVAYSQLGFRSPLNDAFVSDGDGGDDKFDIYLIDFGGRGDGQYRLDACLAAARNRCAGHMLLENDFAGYGYPSIETAIRIVGSHELFHAVQAGYAAGQDLIVSEATAVWATERFDPTLNDFEAFIRRFLERPERSIFVAPSGLVDGYPYSVSLFFRFLDERFGPEIVLELWQQLEQTPDVDDWVASVDGILSANYGTSFTDEYEQFAVWNVYTGRRANPTQAYQEGARYPLVASTDAELPLVLDRPRMFAASARYWRFAPGNRETITADLAPTDDDTEGLQLWLVPSGVNATMAPIKVLDQTEVSTEDVESMMLAVINPLQTGSSLRPTVCVGSPQEVETCKANAQPSDGGMGDDAGMPDGGDMDAGGSPDGGVDPGPPPETGGCSAHSGAPGGSLLWLLLGVMLWNRHRRAADANTPARRYFDV